MNIELVNFTSYACPRTHAPLTQNNQFLQTQDGKIKYQIRDGIPNFLRYDPVETEETTALLERLNELAGEVGWHQSLESVYGDSKYVIDSKRANYLELLELNHEDVALEIGPSLGQFTSNIAHRVKMLCAMEVVWGQAKFAMERTRQLGCENVFMSAGGDDSYLPYQDSTFSVVIMNLVFEWCAGRSRNEAAIDGQIRMLSEVNRVLKPGGRLFLSTKNRYALRLILGKQDEHVSGMRFGNALPRGVVKVISAAMGKSPPSGLLHSYAGLRSLLERAGFCELRSLWAVPEMRYPDQFIPTDPQSIRNARRGKKFVQGEYRITRLIMPLIPAVLVKYITPGLAFIGTKTGQPQ